VMRRPRELSSSTGEGRRQYKGNGVPGLGEALGSAAAIEEGAAEGGGVAATQCTL
jgi:hypothetical protein